MVIVENGKQLLSFTIGYATHEICLHSLLELFSNKKTVKVMFLLLGNDNLSIICFI